MISEAYFDCLQIASELDLALGGATRIELQRIAFLSCLLSIYLANPVSDWGYKFANIGSGLPFSSDLGSAAEFLLASGSLREELGQLRITDKGRLILQRLCCLQTMSPRIRCVSAAASSLLALPSSIVTQGLEQEPTTAASRMRDGPTMLLDEPHLHALHDHFAALAQVIPPGEVDLLSPSVLWLTYMAHEKGEPTECADGVSGEVHVSMTHFTEHAPAQRPPQHPLPEAAP